MNKIVKKNEGIQQLDSNSYHHIKMAAFQELQEALQIRNVNDELLEYLASSLNWLLHYSSKYNINLPEEDRIYEVVERAMAIASKLPSNIPITDESLQAHNNDNNRHQLDRAELRKIY